MFKLTNELFSIQVRNIQNYYLSNDLIYPSDEDASSFLRKVSLLSEDFSESNFSDAVDIINTHVEFYDIEQKEIDSFKAAALKAFEKISKSYEFEKSNTEKETVH